MNARPVALLRFFPLRSDPESAPWKATFPKYGRIVSFRYQTEQEAREALTNAGYDIATN